MPSSFRRIYDKFISTIKDVRERFGAEREPTPTERVPQTPAPRDTRMFEVSVPAGLVQPIEVRPFSSIAYLNKASNRLTDRKTGLFISGSEYRERLSGWRSGMLDALINKNFPLLDAGERAIVIDHIESVRASDLTPEEKDDVIRGLIGSP